MTSIALLTFIAGFWLGGIFGFLIAAVMAASSRASREEERAEEVYDAW